ncbi:MAG TPA: FG-GAP-like repeat-containing protein [Pyrinomonadaceae bacterium]|jgi:Tol biopolymer transport system component
MLSLLRQLCAPAFDYLQCSSFEDWLVKRTFKNRAACKLLLVLLALVCAPSPKAWASLPLSGTLSPTATAPVSWIGTASGPASVSSATSCREGLDCDTFILTFGGTAAEWAGKTARIKINWQLPATDYDLYILRELPGGGSYILAQSNNHLATSEALDFDPGYYGIGRYLVRVMYTAANYQDQYEGSAAVVVAESSCRVPGLTVLEDQTGDSIDLQASHDIQSVSVAEPYLVGTSKLVFTIKVGDLNSLTPNTFWRLYFRAPSVTGARYFVDMRVNTIQASNQSPMGEVEFKYGTGDNTTLGDADEGHYNPQTGTITITVAHAKVGNPRPSQSPAHNLAQMYAQVIVGAAPVDSAPNTGLDLSQASYTVVGNASCNPGQIAFMSNHDGNQEVYVMNAAGSNPINLSNHPASDLWPSWSPDGKKLAFASSRDGSYNIFSMDADGSNQTNLTNMPGTDGDPAWSPDGTKIAFHSWRDANLESATAQIYVMNASGSNQVRLTHDRAYYYSPTWSPNGRKLLFWGGDGIMQIFVMNSDGTNLVQLTNDSFENRGCAWSPDGSRIVFLSNRDGNYEIYVMNADGSNQKRLTNNSADDFLPAWSPDGLCITFVSARDGNHEIYVMNADGSNQTRLTNNPDNESLPAWQPYPTTPSSPSIIALNKSADFDGDHKADLAVWNPANGFGNSINSSNGAVNNGSWASGTVPVPRDYDGDVKSDFGVYYQYQGIWIIQLSGGGMQVGPFGQAGDVPVLGDYDGDGEADAARYHASGGLWYIEQSTGGPRVQQWGGFYDRPVPGDYDGDGKTDIAVYKPNEGSWYILKSGGGTQITAWGMAGDVLVPADYDGDGKTDLAVYRPSESNWYIIQSSNGLPRVQQWGIRGDVLVPADYDGDGKADLAIWRRSTGTWRILRSSDGTTTIQSWGQKTDLPVLYFGFA